MLHLCRSTVLATCLVCAAPVLAKTKPAAAPKAPAAKAPAKPLPPPIVRGKFTDSRNGKTYATVVVGKQTWMAQNLDFMTRRTRASP